MLRISGFFNNYADADLLTVLIKDNNELLNSTSQLKIIQRFSYKKSNTFGVKLLVDPVSFGKIMKSGEIRIGWEICQVAEAFSILRCYKCNEYNHASDKCTKLISCPKCGGAHAIADCVSEISECINCKKASMAFNIVLPLDHAAWSDKCRVYQEKVAIERTKIKYNMSA